MTQRARRRDGRTTNLRIADSPRAAWEGVIRDWLRGAAARSWQRALPALVVLPTSSHAHAWKARLLQDGLSHLGLRFVTPLGLREILSRDERLIAPPREHLRLLLAASGDQTVGAPPPDESDENFDAEKLAARAVLRTPDHLLRALDRLAAAGWEFDDLKLRSFAPIVSAFREQLHACGFDLVANVDRATLARVRAANPLFSNVLVAGFDSAHWPLWFLLRAAVDAAENATVVLDLPRGDFTPAEECWLGSWEDLLGEALPISLGASTDGCLFSECEMRGASRPASQCTFLVGSDVAAQADAVSLQCLRFLAEPTCTRLGIVFGAGGALPRLVSRELARLEIPHNDALAHPFPGLFESAEWRAWIELQRGPRVASFLRFINALDRRDSVFPGLTARALERTLREAYSEVLIDDLGVLRRYCASEKGGTRELAANALATVRSLPARATLTEFLVHTEAAFAQLGWSQHWSEITNRAGAWTGKLSSQLPRTLFLRWLEEIASTFSAGRAPTGDHAYARVQLLTVPQAYGQEWSHLIFAGWNEGSWPPPTSAEFVREDDIELFNRGVQTLNRRATRQGSHGEGHISIREGHSVYLGPVEQRQIAVRQFDALLDSATEGVALSASLLQEATPERLWNPSELFTRLYQQMHRAPLTHSRLSSLQQATAAWVERARSLTSATSTSSVSIGQTRVAFDARRDSSVGSGEYDFGFRERPAAVPVLSVSDFESLVSAPGLIWMRRYLGVEGAEDDGNPWSAAGGRWVHRWLAAAAETAPGAGFIRMPTATEADRRMVDAAVEKRAEVTGYCEAAQKTLPDWWCSGWQNALCLARILGAKTSVLKDWRWRATEWKIEPGEPITIGHDVTLLLRGRIDLILSRNETAPDSLATGELWIIDYKTGSKKPLVAAREDVAKRHLRLHNRILRGEALQLALYALAVQHLGAGDVLLSIVSPVISTVEPQLSSSDVHEQMPIFADLARMQQTGVFGMYGPLRSAFGYARAYPLATLAIDQDILEQKRELTYPALLAEEDEGESW